MTLKTADIKKKLKEITGIAASDWSRWAKYKVGSPTDMEPSKDPNKGLKFGKEHPQLEDTWVRLFGAPSDGEVTAAAVFVRDDAIVCILDIGETKNHCGNPTPGAISGPECWAPLYPYLFSKQEPTYGVITQIGYVEEAHPSMVWWVHVGPAGKDCNTLAQELRQLVIDFFADQFQGKDCCRGQKPSKKNKFCKTCGERLGADSLYGHKHFTWVENLVQDIHLGTNDSIPGNNADGIRPSEFFEEHGWYFDRGPSSGYIATIDSFDQYVDSHECWGDMARKFYGFIGEMKATFEKI
jgi:hypothetical protein